MMSLVLALGVQSGYWIWIILGLVLVGIELLAPGMFMIWVGIAALLTGVLASMLSLSWQLESLLFVLLSVMAVLLGRKVMGAGIRPAEADPFLNRRGDALIGKVFTLDGPLINGEGRIRVDDTVWRVTGADAAAGSRVRATGIDGTALTVEPAL